MKITLKNELLTATITASNSGGVVYSTSEEPKRQRVARIHRRARASDAGPALAGCWVWLIGGDGERYKFDLLPVLAKLSFSWSISATKSAIIQLENRVRRIDSITGGWPVRQ